LNGIGRSFVSIIRPFAESLDTHNSTLHEEAEELVCNEDFNLFSTEPSD